MPNKSTPIRIRDLTDGIGMVVTDLHGCWPVYQQYRDRFLALQAAGKADYLIFLGDLIHRYDGAEDGSIPIILDLIRLQQELGDRLVVLLGNHEMVHLYALPLQKGETIFTPGFEAAMGENRAEMMRFLDERPFFIRTGAGVAMTHAGATELNSIEANQLFNFSHRELWQEGATHLSSHQRHSLRQFLAQQHGRPYAELAATFLAVTDENDPRYDDFLIGQSLRGHFQLMLLWRLFFSYNEMHFKDKYPTLVTDLLYQLSNAPNAPAQQQLLITGHISCRGGHHLVTGGQQLRLASYQHATPPEAGQYLRLDLSQPPGSGTAASGDAAASGAAALRPFLETIFR